MRQALLRNLLVALSLAASGCGVSAVGLAPTAPPLENRLFSRTLVYAPVDSLVPTLRWQALDADLLHTTAEITGVTYEVRVWKTVSGYSGTPAYAREGIEQPSHRLEEPLAPSTQYLWSVRAHFTLDGQRWVTEWGMAGNLMRDQVVPNASCYRFETPPHME